jgi:zinc transport system ATP-binding protein
MSGDKVIEIRNLSFAYDNKVVLSEVNLYINRGDFVAFLGPNGGGKTTLVKILVGIFTRYQGDARVFGDVPGTSPARVGYVPQDIHARESFPMTVLELALMGRLGIAGRKRKYNSKDITIAEDCLDMVGMSEFRNTSLIKLSGGQKQRAYIARALTGQPELLFLDEPVSGVDTEWQSNLFELLKELNKNTTIVVVSHDLTVMSSYIKSVTCINRNVYYHPSPTLTAELLEKTYHCPVDLIAHGMPHRVFAEHDHDGDESC